MTISAASRAADSPAPDYAEQILNEVRARIAAERPVLDLTRERRDAVLHAAKKFFGALATFGSGSLAHATVNNPVKDADGGSILDRRSWPLLGPDGGGVGPHEVMREVAEFVRGELFATYPKLTVDLSKKRAILFEFHEPIDDEDPSVDLMLCLTRRGQPGFWIPNCHNGGWDPSDPQKHTELMTGPPKGLRVHRARVIRLAKAAINGDGDPGRVLIPWNISALGLGYIKETEKLSVALAIFFAQMADSIERGPTPDPAGVSPPIKLPEGISQERAAKRLRYFAACVQEAVDHSHDHRRALAALAKVFPEQLPEAPRDTKQGLADQLRRDGRSAGLTSAFGAVSKQPRSFGDAPA